MNAKKVKALRKRLQYHPNIKREYESKNFPRTIQVPDPKVKGAMKSVKVTVQSIELKVTDPRWAYQQAKKAA